MAQKAYIASVTIEIIVVADSEESAKQLAADAYKDEVVWAEDFELGPLSYLPATYEDLEDNVETDGPSMTVGQAIKLPGGYQHNL